MRFYVDDAVSGTSTLGRREFLQTISDAENPSCDFNKIIVYDVKRFGWLDNDEAGYYRHRLRCHGVEICYVSENFNVDYTDDLLSPVKQWQAWLDLAIHRLIRKSALHPKKVSGHLAFDKAELDIIAANGDQKRGRRRPRKLS